MIWLSERTAKDWLNFVGFLLLWPVVLIIYIVQTIQNLFKLSGIISPLNIFFSEVNDFIAV